MEANDPQGVVNLDPRVMVDMIYIGDRQTFLYTKYMLWPSWLQIRCLKFFPLFVYESYGSPGV